MTGWRKRTIMEMAQETMYRMNTVDDSAEYWTATDKELEAFAKLVREDALAQPAPVQEPVFELQESGWEIICDLDWIQTLPFGTKLYTTPPAAQREERNFCPRCGKRTQDLTTIHTCTPPQENT